MPSFFWKEKKIKSIKELINLKGRVALITGGAGHIGKALGEALAEGGASIAVLDREESACKNEARRLENDFGVKALPLPIDLSSMDMIKKAPGKILQKWGRIDILVNGAAFVGTSTLTGWATPFMEQSDDTWTKALHVNLTAPFVLSQVCSKALAESGHGSIINIASTYGLVGPDMKLYEGTSMGNPAAYAASKGGLLQLTRWLATVLAPKIRVNAITPGGVFRDQPETFVAQYVQRTPLQRMATEEDFKGAVVYLASDLSRYVTGHNLVVDGGWTAW